METREASSPRPRIPFDLDWFDAFNYAAGVLQGQGPWLASTLLGFSAVVASAGHVTSPGSGIGGNYADDAFENFDVTRPWALTLTFNLPATNGTFNGLSLYMGNTTTGYVGLGLEVGSLVYPPGHAQLAQDGPSGGTPTNPDGGNDKAPVLQSGDNTVTLEHVGSNKFRYLVNGVVEWTNMDFDTATIPDPYPEFDFQSDLQPGTVVIRSIELTQSNQ